jgi:hypothetical protein
LSFALGSNLRLFCVCFKMDPGAKLYKEDDVDARTRNRLRRIYRFSGRFISSKISPTHFDGSTGFRVVSSTRIFHRPISTDLQVFGSFHLLEYFTDRFRRIYRFSGRFNSSKISLTDFDGSTGPRPVSSPRKFHRRFRRIYRLLSHFGKLPILKDAQDCLNVA